MGDHFLIYSNPISNSYIFKLLNIQIHIFKNKFADLLYCDNMMLK